MKFVEIEWKGPHYASEIDLRDRLLRAPLGLTFTAEDIEAEARQLHFGILHHDQLIACAVVVPLEDGVAKLRQMAVDHQRQRGGVGSHLIREIEDELRRRQFRKIELNARKEAVAFYERLGYRRVGERFIEVKIPHWKMMRVIDETPAK
ncbi:MAG: GNAT family N-acetyltransferase [Rubripirellula sp.]